MSAPMPPFDLQAEQAVLGSCLISGAALATVLELVSDDDWYRPAHEMIWGAIRSLHIERQGIDAITVAARLGTLGKLTLAGGGIYLHTLMASVATTVNVDFHARIVAAHAVRRRILSAFGTLQQRAGNPDCDLDAVIEDGKLELEIIGRTRLTDGPIRGLHTWSEFLELHADKVENWVVPGLIGRKDVWMILAPPGAGKTTLSRQICWAIAAGVHPFRWSLKMTEPKRTLLIDLENDEGMAADESKPWFGRIDSLGAGVEDRGWVWSYPQGLNVREAKDASLLDQVIGDTHPEFVALGSLYKSFTRSGDWDQAAGEARVAFDRLRARHQVAFWFEHHMPKGGADGARRHTPFGSSVWEWWASHGRVLEPAVTGHRLTPYFFTPFRGDRRHVETPVGFTRGKRMPWEPVWTELDLTSLVEACKV